MAETTGGSVRKATILIWPPHAGPSSGSTSYAAREIGQHRIDVIDVNTGLGIARLEREPGEGAFLSFVGRGEIAGIEPTPEGDLRLGIWTLRLTTGDSN